MTLEEYKDVLQLYKLTNSWIEDYTTNNLEKHSVKLKKQHKKMLQLQSKTEQLIEKQVGEVGKNLDADDLQEKIITLGKGTAAFASCFGDTKISFDSKASISLETALLAIQLKKLTATWYGNFSDSSQDNTITSLMASIHERAKKLIAAPKTLTGDTISVVFYGSKNKKCRRMRRNIEAAQEMYEGLLNIELHLVEDEDEIIHQLGIENFPTTIFKRNKEKIAKHEGYLGISALQQKIEILLTGAHFSDSSSIKSVKNMKSVNQKELYSLGEYLIFYFEASWCGICKKTTPVVQELSDVHHKVKFEQIQVDGSHFIHKSFGVNEVPAIVFVHDGKVIGKHTGYINPSNLKHLIDQFAISNKRNIGNSTSGSVSIIDKDLEDLESGRKVKNKYTSDEERIV